MTERTPPDAPRGNLLGFINSAKAPGDDRPAFQGKLSLPGQSAERGFALWAHTSEKTGDVVLSGRAGDSAAAQIDKLTKPPRQHDTDTTIQIAQKNGAEGLKIEPHAIVLFTNKQKDGENPNRPNYWGYYNPGGGDPLMKLAAWAKTDRRGNAMLTGSLQRDEPARERETVPEKPRRHSAPDYEEEREDEMSR